VAAQHVLVTYRGAKNAPKDVKRTKAAAKKLAEEILAKARSGSDFTGLVKEYSEDPGTKDRLGSVGKFTPDKMVKPFSDAAFALKVDEVSEVVETEFGFHVIKRNQ
jgi:parvulin-like peptidyl-prolyl isomerase